MEKQVQIHQQHLQKIYDAISAGILIHTREGRLLHVNQSACEILNLSREEMLSSTTPLGWHIIEEDGTRCTSHCIFEIEALTENPFQKKVWGIYSPSMNQYKWISVHTQPTWGADGELDQLITTITDISEEKQTAHLYRSLIEESLVAVYLFDMEHFYYVNPRFTEIFGYDEQEALELSVFDIIPTTEVDKVKEMIRKRLDGEVQSARYEVRGRRKDGTEVDLLSMGVVTTYKGKRAIVGTCMDISEQKQADEWLKRSDKLNLIGQLSAAVAHEIRNPLTTLRGFIQLWKNALPQPDYGEVMLKELDRINLIVSEFLMLAKPQASYFEPSDIKDLIHHVLSILEPQGNLCNIQLSLEMPSELPLICCEANQIKQVLMNLLKNAMEAMPDGGEIKIRVEEQSDYILMEVMDKGMGIPQEQLPKLGEPFFTTKENGTGLGLMICQKIISDHRGKIGFESEQGKGTKVSISLPKGR